MLYMRSAILGLVTAIGLGASVVQAEKLQILSAEGDPNSVAAIKAAAAEFAKTHPGFELEYQTVSFTEIGQKLVAAVAAGSAPDIVHLDDFGLSVLSSQGMLLTAEDVVQAIGKDDYFPTPLRVVTFHNKIWGVPFANGFNLLWYRKDLYEAYGLQPPKTWQDLLNNAQKLNGNLPKFGQMYGIALALGNANQTNDTIQNFIWSNGGTILNKEGKIAFNSSEAKAAIEYLAELYKSAPPGVAQYGNMEVINAFAAGKVAHAIYPARVVGQILRTNPEMAKSVGVAMVPKGPSPTGRFAAVLFSKAWGFPKGSQNTKLAKEFVQFLQTGEREIRWLHSVPIHFWPPRKSVAESAAYSKNDVIGSELGQSVVRFVISDGLPGAQSQLTESGVVNTKSFKILQAHVLAKMMQKIVVGKIPVDTAISQAVDEAKRILDQ